MGKFVQKSTAEQHVVAKDKDGEDVTALWHNYDRLTSQANMLGLGQQVPPQIGVAQINMHEDGHHIVIK
eukprot:3683309-Prorocentrum_lima.AAC.1